MIQTVQINRIYNITGLWVFRILGEVQLNSVKAGTMAPFEDFISCLHMFYVTDL